MAIIDSDKLQVTQVLNDAGDGLPDNLRERSIAAWALIASNGDINAGRGVASISDLGVGAWRVFLEDGAVFPGVSVVNNDSNPTIATSSPEQGAIVVRQFTLAGQSVNRSFNIVAVDGRDTVE